VPRPGRGLCRRSWVSHRATKRGVGTAGCHDDRRRVRESGIGVFLNGEAGLTCRVIDEGQIYSCGCGLRRQKRRRRRSHLEGDWPHHVVLFVAENVTMPDVFPAKVDFGVDRTLATRDCVAGGRINPRDCGRDHAVRQGHVQQANAVG
jgi:hypothetical protein